MTCDATAETPRDVIPGPEAMARVFGAYPSLGGWAWGLPVLIGLSCLFTKQHYVLDVPAGGVLGWVAFRAFPVA